MRPDPEDPNWVKGMRKKVEEEMTKKEIEIVLYWRGEIEKILASKSQSLGPLQLELQNLIQRMQNRVRILKTPQ